MENLYHVSSSPHARSKLTTGRVMCSVILALMPATVVGIIHYGLQAFLIILMSVVTAVLTEFVFDRITKKPNTVTDGSAVLTGLLLALCLPPTVPLYIPFFGSLFAILIVKCLFGGLGHNFVNPALTGRCFLLLSFSGAMSEYVVDATSSATPLARMAAGESVNLVRVFWGLDGGVIGASVGALLIGGIFLCVIRGITLEIPLATLLSFTAFLALFGGHGLDPSYLAVELCSGGIVMAAFFMATDPVTSPVTSSGQIVFGVLIGILGGVFRVYGNTADSVSYAVIIANLTVPLIDRVCIPVPYGFRKRAAREREGKKRTFPKAALILFVITLIAGLCLGGVYRLTKDTIEEQQLAANAASYREVCPDAEEFSYDDRLNAVIEDLDGEVYGTDFGKAYINTALVGTDASGAVVGYVISVTSADGVEGDITLSAGIAADGTLNAIAFTELNETAGLGSLCGEDAFKGQFEGVKTDAFVLNKSGDSTADNEIDSVSGASVSSQAVVNAVNAALDFFAVNIE